MSGLPHALIQLLSRTVMLKCVKLRIVSKAPYIEGTSIKSIKLCTLKFACLMVTLGLMVHCG